MTDVQALHSLSSLPPLDLDGANWTIFRQKFIWYLESLGLEDHLDADLYPSKMEDKPESIKDEKPDERRARIDEWRTKKIAWMATNKEWKKDDSKAKSTLGRLLPNSLLLECQTFIDFVDMWDFLETRFQKTSYAQRSILKGKFHTISCGERDDVKAHLMELENIYQQLAARNILISDDEYIETIIRSLPLSYSSLTSTILTLYDTSTILKLQPTYLKDVILKEYEVRQMKMPKTKRSGEIALGVDTSKSKNGKEKKRSARKPNSGEQDLSKITCFNCGGKGHKADKCPSPKQPKGEKKAEKRAEAATSAVVDDDSDDVAWAALEELGDVPHSADSLSQDSRAPDENEISLSEIIGDLPKVVEPTVIIDAGKRPAISPHLATLAKPQHTTKPTTCEILDSGATRHMTPDRHRLRNFKHIPDRPISAANQELFSATGIGEMTVRIPNGQDYTDVTLRDVLYAPKMGITLISVGRIDEAGYTATFKGGACTISNSKGKCVGYVPKLQGLYRINTSTLDTANVVETLTIDELHRRHGHVNHTSLRSMVKAGMITGVTLKTDSTPSPCRPCIVAKAKHLPVNKVRLNPISKHFGDLVYSDVWGPATTRTIGHALYFVLFIDDHTRWIISNLMRLKSLVFTNYCHFEAWAKTQFGANVKMLQSDKGGEYCSTEFENHCKTSGTVHRFAVHDVHQHNGVAERANYTLLDGVRAVLVASGLPTFLWGEALNYIVWIRNRSPTKALDGKTPYEVLYGHPPNISGLHEWGSLCWVARKHSKLADRADEGRWMGPDNNSKGQRIYWPDRRSITVEYDVKFVHAPNPLLLEGEIEDYDPLPISLNEINQPESTAIKDLSLEPPSETAPLPNPQSPLSPLTPLPESLPPSPKTFPSLRDKDRNWSDVDKINLLPGRTRSSARIVDKPTPEEMNELHLEGELTANSVEIAMAAMTAEAEGLEPQGVKELKGRPDKMQWEDAMKDEIDRLNSRGTWKVVKKPNGVNVIGSKWVFRLKKNANGEVQAYRARLVAQGNYQIDGVDVFDTFSPVARLAAIRTVLALATRLDWEIHQVDV